MKLTNHQINEIVKSINSLVSRVDENGKPIETAAWFCFYVNLKRLNPLVDDIMKEQIELFKKYCKIENEQVVFEGQFPVFLSEESKQEYIKNFSQLVSAERTVDLYQIKADEIKNEKFDMDTILPLLDTVIITE